MKFRTCCILLVMVVGFQFRTTPLSAEKVMFLGSHSAGDAFDLSDDLGCVWWNGVTESGTGGADAATIFTPANGVTNANLINQAIADGKKLSDKYGRYFPVAAASTAQPFAIRIPQGRFAGAIQGTGFIARGGIPPGGGHLNAGTTFVCTTDPTVVPYNQQGVIEIRSVHWNLGPFNVIGRYVPPGTDATAAVVAGQVPMYGLHFPTAPAGRVTGAINFFYLQQGIVLDRDSSNLWEDIGFRGVRDCYVANDIQAVGNRVLKVSIGEDCGTVFKFNEGGSLYVDQVLWNKPATLLEIGAPQDGSNRFELHGIQADAQLFRVTSETEPDSRITDLLGRPAMLVRRADGNNTAVCAIRASGSLSENPQSWFLNHRFLDQLRGFHNDVSVDITGLPADEAAPFATKASPQAYPTAFTSPDLAKGDNFAPPDSDKVVAWWDMSQDGKLNGGTFTDGSAITGLATRFGEDWTFAPSTTAPTIVDNGLHHRRALHIGGSGRYLTKSSETRLRGLEELEVHLVASMADPAQSNLSELAEREIAANWRRNATTGRSWRIYMIRQNNNPSDGRVFAQISFDGSETDKIILECPTRLGWDTPALITLRYNGTGIAKAGLQPGEAELVVNGVPDKEARDNGPAEITGSSDADLRVGVSTNSNGDAMNGMKGRVAELAILDELSTYTPGTDSTTGATADTGELVTIRSYFRKKYGVW